MESSRESVSAKTDVEQFTEWAQPIAEKIMDHYQLRYSPSFADLYTEDAVFDDPVAVLRGPASIDMAFRLLPRIFDRVEVVRGVDAWTYHPAVVGAAPGEPLVLSDDGGGGFGGRLVRVPPQARAPVVLRWRLRSVGLEFTLPTLIVLSFCENSRRVTRHEDRWHGKPTNRWGAPHRAFKEAHGWAFASLLARRSRTE